MRVGRYYRFEAAHRLVASQLSDEENWIVYGKCSREGGHGHNYEVLVIFEGEPDPETGWVIDPRLADQTVEEHLLRRVDHRNLNEVVDEVTTGENLARVFHRWLKLAFDTDAVVASVELVETPRNRFITI